MAKPELALKEKGIDVAVWKGERGPTITVRKTYKDKNSGEWKESKIMFPEEVPVLIALLSQVDRYCKEQKTKPALLAQPASNKDDDVPF